MHTAQQRDRAIMERRMIVLITHTRWGRVEICDEGGTPVPGFAMADANEIHDDSVEHEVRWKAGPDVTRLQHRPIRLRFRMRHAELYAFRFR